MQQELSLAARLTIAIMALVVFTAGAVGFLGYRSTVAVTTQRALVRLDTHARALASDLANIVKNARADAKGFRYGVGLMDIIAGNGNAQALETFGARVARRYAAELVAKPDYAEFTIIGVADGGRELIRVRRGEDNVVRIVPNAELRSGIDAATLAPILDAPDGTSVVSTMDFTPASGAPGFAYRPSVRVATPLITPGGTPFGVLIINIDLREVFKRFAEVASRDTRLFLANERGDYLPQPEDRPGQPARIQDDFPALARAVGGGGKLPDVISRRDGKRFFIGFAQVLFQDGPRLSIIEAAAEDNVISDPGAALVNSSLIGGAVAVIGAVLLAGLLARTLIRPLTQMTSAVADFSLGKPLVLPVKAGGEIGVLARAFETMAREVREKAAAIQRDKEVFEGIMATMAESVLLVDATGALLYQNSASMVLVGMLLNKDTTWNGAFDVFQVDGTTPLPRDQWPSARSLRGEAVDDMEMLFRLQGTGALKHLVCSARPIRDEAGLQTGAVIVTRDVTQAKETERQLHQSQKLESIGQLTGGVAHDFNNMLTVITGTAEILIDSLADNPELLPIARMIDQAADRGAALTRHLLAFARKQPLQPRDVDVNGMVIDVAQLLRPTLGEQIEIESALEDDVRLAHIDPSQLSAALLNLAVNARDAMPDGGRLLLETGNVVLDEVYAQHNPGVVPGNYIMIAVSDTGTGIPAHLRDKVFEPFFTTKDVGKGTGLGLSMVYGFVKQSNGHIKIYSEEGHGTTIKLYLPPATGISELYAAHPSIEGGGETIFVVEDDPLVCSFVVAQLQSLGYRTLTASGGASALEQIDCGAAFDLLFTDVIMPGGMNGRQLADAVVRRRPQTRVLYTSGYTENAIVHHGRLDANVLLLPKPYRKFELAKMIRIALTSGQAVAADVREKARAG